MRVTNKMMLGNFVYNLMKNQEATDKKMKEITTGKRINTPSDDPIGTARSMTMRSSLNELEQYANNSKNGISWLDATDEALSSVDQSLQRVYELVISGGSNSLPESSRKALAEEVDQIRNGLVQIANTNIDNRYIFSGEQVREAAYSSRMVVNGESQDLKTNPIVIDASNNQFKIKLDDGSAKVITLTNKTYDGTVGNTMTELTADIQKQLDLAGFDAPVYVKTTTDNRLAFYAGAKPADGSMHSLVLKNGPAIKTTGTALFLAGSPVNQLKLDVNTSTVNDYYNGWSVAITSGTGQGQIRQITDFDGASHTITGLNSDWKIVPDNTSVYTLVPPLEGTSTASGANTLTLDATAASQMNDFYNGMSITVNSGTDSAQTRTIVGYDAATRTVTLDNAWTTPPVAAEYVITPHLDATVQSATNSPATIMLDAAASAIDNFYNGTSITVTNANGTTESKKITAYDAATKVATLDSNWVTVPTLTSKYSIGDTSLLQLGFNNQATTNQLTGSSLNEPILVIGKYPLVDMAQGSTGPANITLNEVAGSTDNYYQGWTVTITKGTGAGQTRTISGYNGTTKDATVGSNWDIAPDATSEYSLNPPVIDAVPGAAGGPNQIRLAAGASTIDDFYKGMPITITSGNGQGQTRTITAYDAATGTATLDSDWSTIPDATSSYSIDANSYVNSSNKFKIKVGDAIEQEISLDGGSYSLLDLATQMQAKIQARGGNYANVNVEVTGDKQLRMLYRDPDPDDQDTPLEITVKAGSTADILSKIGFTSGDSSFTAVLNYEGDNGTMQYEVNAGNTVQVNTVGSTVFDSLFKNLTKISQDLRNGNIAALGNEDIALVKGDLEKVLITQGEIGAKVNRLETGIERMDVLNENITSLLSYVEDADLSKAVMDLKVREAAYQAALQMGGRIFPSTLMDYLR